MDSPSTTTVLEKLNILVHPGFSLWEDETPEEHDAMVKLLDVYRGVAQKIDETRELLLILAQHDQKYYSDLVTRRNYFERPMGVFIDEMSHQPEERVVVRYNAIDILEPHCRLYLPTVQRILGLRQQTIDATTMLSVFGEYADQCVSRVAMNMGKILSIARPQVPLEFTNVRTFGAERLAGYKEGGDYLPLMRKKYPTVDYIPIPEGVPQLR